jgi:hypothetical protein
MVLLKNEEPSSKLDKAWTGPYIVKELEDFGNILISHKTDPKDVMLVNPRRIKKYFEKENVEEKFYEVKKILKQRGTGNNLEYFVRWKGYSSEFDSWINGNDEANNIADLITDWNEKQSKKKKRNREPAQVALTGQLKGEGVMDWITNPSGIPNPSGP